MWNAEPGEDMGELAGEMVLVEFKNGEPDRQPYGSFAFNARAREDGKLEPLT